MFTKFLQSLVTHSYFSYSEVTGHPLKIESGEGDQTAGTPAISLSKQPKSEFKTVSSLGKNAKTDDTTIQEDSNKNLKKNNSTNVSVRHLFDWC